MYSYSEFQWKGMVVLGEIEDDNDVEVKLGIVLVEGTLMGTLNGPLGWTFERTDIIEWLGYELNDAK